MTDQRADEQRSERGEKVPLSLFLLPGLAVLFMIVAIAIGLFTSPLLH